MESNKTKIKNLEERIKILEEYSNLVDNKDNDVLLFIERLKNRKKSLELNVDPF